MILYINPIGENIILLVIENSQIIWNFTIEKGDDFSQFPEKVIDIMNAFTIDMIWCICWPWAFTRMRIVTLTLNTLTLTKKIPLKWCHFFDIIDSENPILKANGTEYIVRVWHGEHRLILKENLANGIYTGYGDQNDFTEGKVFIQYREDIAHIEKIFVDIPPVDTLNPIYLKDPHITWSKKNTSLS